MASDVLMGREYEADAPEKRSEQRRGGGGGSSSSSRSSTGDGANKRVKHLPRIVRLYILVYTQPHTAEIAAMHVLELLGTTWRHGQNMVVAAACDHTSNIPGTTVSAACTKTAYADTPLTLQSSNCADMFYASDL